MTLYVLPGAGQDWLTQFDLSEMVVHATRCSTARHIHKRFGSGSLSLSLSNLSKVNHPGFIQSCGSLQRHFHKGFGWGSYFETLKLVQVSRCVRVRVIRWTLTLSAGPALQSLCGSSGWQNSCQAHCAETLLLLRQRWPQRSPSRCRRAGSLWSACSLGRYLQWGRDQIIFIVSWHGQEGLR